MKLPNIEVKLKLKLYLTQPLLGKVLPNSYEVRLQPLK